MQFQSHHRYQPRRSAPTAGMVPRGRPGSRDALQWRSRSPCRPRGWWPPPDFARLAAALLGRQRLGLLCSTIVGITDGSAFLVMEPFERLDTGSACRPAPWPGGWPTLEALAAQACPPQPSPDELGDGGGRHRAPGAGEQVLLASATLFVLRGAEAARWSPGRTRGFQCSSWRRAPRCRRTAGRLHSLAVTTCLGLGRSVVRRPAGPAAAGELELENDEALRGAERLLRRRLESGCCSPSSARRCAGYGKRRRWPPPGLLFVRETSALVLLAAAAVFTAPPHRCRERASLRSWPRIPCDRAAAWSAPDRGPGAGSPGGLAGWHPAVPTAASSSPASLAAEDNLRRAPCRRRSRRSASGGWTTRSRTPASTPDPPRRPTGPDLEAGGAKVVLHEDEGSRPRVPGPRRSPVRRRPPVWPPPGRRQAVRVAAAPLQGRLCWRQVAAGGARRRGQLLAVPAEPGREAWPPRRRPSARRCRAAVPWPPLEKARRRPGAAEGRPRGHRVLRADSPG